MRLAGSFASSTATSSRCTASPAKNSGTATRRRTGGARSATVSFRPSRTSTTESTEPRPGPSLITTTSAGMSSGAVPSAAVRNACVGCSARAATRLRGSSRELAAVRSITPSLSTRISGRRTAMADVAERLFATCRRCGRMMAQASAQGRPRLYCDALDCKRARSAERLRESRRRRSVPVTTVTFGTNDQLIAEVAKLYLADGAVIADVTYSSGRFWKKANLSRFTFLASYLIPSPAQRVPVLACDFRALPYATGSVDALIFDPPYIHAPGKGMLNHRYNGLQTTDLASYAAIMALYKDGMTEAARVLRHGA